MLQKNSHTHNHNKIFLIITKKEKKMYVSFNYIYIEFLNLSADIYYNNVIKKEDYLQENSKMSPPLDSFKHNS